MKKYNCIKCLNNNANNANNKFNVKSNRFTIKTVLCSKQYRKWRTDIQNSY